MALIQCPECKKEVSDKATICIHCGFPLDSLHQHNEGICSVDGIEYDLSDVINVVDQDVDFNNLRYADQVQLISDLSGVIQKKVKMNIAASCRLASTILRTHEIPPSFDTSEKIRCPKCGSTSITTGARGINWKLGLIGASKTVNRCASCGFTFDPKTKKKV